MPPPEDTMRERIEIVQILRQMRQAETGNPLTSGVVQDLSRADRERVENAQLYFTAGARIGASWDTQATASAVEPDLLRSPSGEIMRRRPSIKYRIAERRNVDHQVITFRDDED